MDSGTSWGGGYPHVELCCPFCLVVIIRPPNEKQPTGFIEDDAALHIQPCPCSLRVAASPLPLRKGPCRMQGTLGKLTSSGDLSETSAVSAEPFTHPYF